MHRREYLASSASVAAISLTVCIGVTPTQTDPRIRGEEPTLHPGDTATISVTASDVDQLNFGIPLDGHHILNPDSFAVTPPPTAVAESLPPVWFWDRPRDEVQASFTVTVVDDAVPQELTYLVNVANGDQEDTVSFTILIAPY